MLELILASAIGSVIIAASYASYGIVSKQFNRLSEFSDVQERGLPTIRLLERDLRMAGYKALDSATLESTYGNITDPITITDSGNACCDTLVIIYDKSTTERRRITYFAQSRTDPERTALYMDIDLWNGTSWDSSIDDALVTDYIEDFQVEGSDNNADGDPRIVDISLMLKGKNQLPSTQSYSKPSYDPGNFNYTFSDNYHRQVFNATINVRNLRNDSTL